MFNNWISFGEIMYFAKKLRHKPEVILKIIPGLSSGKFRRTQAAWSHTESPPTNWWDVPAVTRRWNYLISGDSAVDYCEYICKKYLADKDDLRVLSLGCGTGTRELRWAETQKLSCIDAYDLSETRIRYAADMAKQKEFGHILNFQVQDVFNIDTQADFYDVILCEGSLHHFSPLGRILQRISHFLKPDGYFIVNEFVGPTRFQWTSRQLEIVNSLLAMFPPRYKTLWDSKVIKPKVFRPSKLSMILTDPSEAIESSKILPLLYSMFDVAEIKGYGGTILHLLLNGIAHHFLTRDVESQRLLNICFEVEDMLLAEGEIQDDFIVGVCKKRL